MQQQAEAESARDQSAQEAVLRFRTLFENAPISVLLLSPDGRVLQVNKAWFRLWGVAEDDHELLHFLCNDYDILRDPQLEAMGVTPYLRRALAGESVSAHPVRYDPSRNGKSGRIRWVVTHLHPLLDKSGAVRELMIIYEDVTSKQETEQNLRLAEERLRLATEAGNIGIWEWDMEKDRMEWSERVFRLHGIWPSQFGGRVQDFLALVHGDDHQRLREHVRQAIRNQGQYSAEFRALLPDGQVRWLSTWARIHNDEHGKPSRMVGATISIDAWKKAEAVLKEGDRRKDEFLAMLAHELRNPLAPIATAAQLLQVPGLDDEYRRQSIDVIARQVNHMCELMDNLLDVSRVTRGLVTLQRESLDLKAVIASAIEQVRPLLEQRRHSLITGITPEALGVYGDRIRLVQVLVNLLNNAAKYTPPGGRIELRAETLKAQVRLSIADNGVGIDANLLPRLFDLFVQGSRTPDRALGGLGIGLPLVKRLMKLHGGSVDVQSEGPGKGSTFSLVLPLLPNLETSLSKVDDGPLSTASGLRILLVDDNRDAAETLATLLSLQGHQVAVQETAGAALLAAERHPPQVLILDIGLPDMDGYTLVRRLRELPALNGALFIALTGYGQAQDRAASKAAGFDHHFVKPLDMRALDGLLTAWP